jgi:hypothetical protein
VKPTVYIETTIVSYLTCRPSKEIIRRSHEMITGNWWSKHRSAFECYTSDFVIDEASRGDKDAAAKRLEVLDGLPKLPVNDDALALAQRVVLAIALPQRARLDAAHVAMAAVHNMDFLLTWNCTHLANGVLAAKIERACETAGFRSPRILTPELLVKP